MLYLPFEKLQIETSLSIDSIETKLRENIEFNATLVSVIYSGSKLFKGKLTLNRFKISRIIRYRNSFLPVIEGEITQNESGSKILVKFRLNHFVLLFWMLWMAGISFSFLMFLLENTATFSFHFVIPLLMWVFGYLICIIPFNIEVEKAKKFFESMFKETMES